VKFWDSSALVPLVSDEERTDDLKKLFEQDRQVVVAFITPLEVTSAVSRKAGVNRDLRREAQRHYAVLAANWSVINEYLLVLTNAERLIAHHRLRSGDAIQLACALIGTGPGARIPFVTLDEELAAAARAEGLSVLP
jgi:predicted nucleic acid-binding protein